MKNFAKYFVLGAVLTLIPACSFAGDISVKDTTSPEFIQNQGYSSEVSRIIEVKTKDLSTPLSTEKPSNWVRFGRYVRETIDPSYAPPGKFVDHNTRFESSTIDDL